MASGLEALAGIAGATGQPERAAQLFGAAAALRESIGAPLSGVGRVFYERILAVARRHSNEADFAQLWVQGEAMSLEQALAYALQDTSGVEQGCAG
jgi:hypothetical protein